MTSYKAWPGPQETRPPQLEAQQARGCQVRGSREPPGFARTGTPEFSADPNRARPGSEGPRRGWRWGQGSGLRRMAPGEGGRALRRPADRKSVV